ncbi:hypothetical protein [Limnohabitans sp. 15K]|uniref:hypothetical protein n=1 Tax=Limnohabitans sp. 15K TaxID=1100706 RepID=UPI000C1E5827|nr:hypothetical protein [Limnohabitans sp. 15K]PIT80230.1 hypothetical protein B9Z40_14745 [Limnohabitans sp. 15K]
MSTLLLKLLLLPPELLRSHAQGYADLAREVGASYLCTLKNRCLLYVLSALTCFLGLILGGVALLLFSAFPLQDAPYVWMLPALPLGLFFLSALCWWWARSLRLEPIFSNFQAQIQLDMLAIQQAQST